MTPVDGKSFRKISCRNKFHLGYTSISLGQRGPLLGGRFGQFLFFSSLCEGGEREEESEAGGGGTFYLEIQRGGGYPTRGGEVVHTGAGRVSRGREEGPIFFFFFFSGGTDMSTKMC